MNDRRELRGVWVILLVACALLVSCADALLLEIGQTFFTAGFNAVYIEGAGALSAFALASLATDLCLITGVWAIGIHFVRRWQRTALQKLVALSLASIAFPFSIDFVHYQVGLVLGRTVSFPVLFEVSGGGFQLMLAEALAQGGPLLVVLALAGLAAAGVLWLTGRMRPGREARLPDPRRLGVSFGALLVVSCVALVGTARALPRVHTGLASKPSASLLVRLIQIVTDVDGDGSGVLSHPVDPAPFDSSRHPFAIDEPGNGVDENGLAGDLPAGWRAPETVAPEPVPRVASRRPDFLLVYLESFRADRLGRERNGREITPFLNELAREGSSSRHAYVHSPYTIWSRAQLFGGSLDPRFGQKTLVDDFEAQGYTVAHFSGQDDSFGHSVELLGLDRVDHFYDARDDIDSRTSRSTNAGALQVSAKLLARRVEEYLGTYSPDEPLFLYVNFVDTHFPYTHEDVEDLLGVSPITRYEISARDAEALRATYDNTTANVDLAIRTVVERFRDAIGGRDHAILVASDHGQALFEEDFLGHGQSLTSDQTRTPFVLFGIGGDWPEPIGMADVRGLLQRHLFAPRGAETPRARFVPDPERRVFHFMAQLRRPHLIGLRSLDGLTSFDFDREALQLYDASGARRDASPGEEIRELEDVVRAWETLRVENPDEDEVRKVPGPA
jgi:hypothetical protein